ncbi:MAG: hypothetical protein QF477_15155 [SAR202 cluster bacterium]|jgi:hypothetical protein|nr:hypothetical protein [SAR202 cluster bacterium]MDP6665379.1 hypothetical protein [SAR202 cluster bacterium]
MTQNSQQIQRRAIGTLSPDRQPIFFFDGDFRTWDEVKGRAQLNAAVERIIGAERTG